MKVTTSSDIFDLWSMKHREIRKAIERRWNEQNDMQLTESEWFILDRINYEEHPLAEVCKNEEMTRQGTHKVIKKLEQQGLVKTRRLDEYKRNKYVKLTDFGIECYEKNKALKQSMEEQIKTLLGHADYERLMEILRIDWQL